jgi:hypothetical protein
MGTRIRDISASQLDTEVRFKDRVGDDICVLYYRSDALRPHVESTCEMCLIAGRTLLLPFRSAIAVDECETSGEKRQ